MRKIETIGGGTQGPEDGRSDHIAGVGAAGSRLRPADAPGFTSLGPAFAGPAFAGPALMDTASLSGAAGRSERPEAMLARGSRVTGSGGAAMSTGSAMPPGQSAGNLVFALPHGSSVAFAALADFSADRFL